MCFMSCWQFESYIREAVNKCSKSTFRGLPAPQQFTGSQDPTGAYLLSAFSYFSNHSIHKDYLENPFLDQSDSNGGLFKI